MIGGINLENVYNYYVRILGFDGSSKSSLVVEAKSYLDCYIKGSQHGHVMNMIRLSAVDV